ncbi:hypothetical protein K2Z83_07520 [Oscillochloris sp. ZM17-4]|uniref:hypothetical protein n=1 Tax=Oscillochloris sp. ZM17-4 TaxID=2866714 RepID=UPI001C732CF5|nr:hypothetical protein [Oscillochloris sp. ZM17-4]MBX0327527.1 hypothetical protein [Oscillochloris sp. ZM17-4]
MTDLYADVMPPPGGDLEKAYIVEYLQGLGYTLEDVKALPAAKRHDLLCAASLFASTRLVDVETRSHLISEMHGGEHPL